MAIKLNTDYVHNIKKKKKKTYTLFASRCDNGGGKGRAGRTFVWIRVCESVGANEQAGSVVFHLSQN